MSDIMKCMPISQLANWTIKEHKLTGTVFGLHKSYKASGYQEIFGRKLETAIGPAAGPNSQLAQNIIASYFAGARFFELKTIQEMDGAELAACVNKPCILADDECYNCEWSTELYVWQAYEEYVKAWFMLHVCALEFELGDVDGFQFNISVGYNLDDIKKDKTNDFIDNMMEAKDTDIFKSCKQWLLDNVDIFEKVTAADIEAIPSNICNSATISTLHGCPPEEIEAIANHLIDNKKINTFIKCNPTLLGYEFARKTMDDMNYDYIEFGDFHFKDDLQYEDAIPMFKRLMAKCDAAGLEFGVKITNTFPVDVKEDQLPSEEMYMSGKSLYPLSISLAAKLAREFDGKLRIAYSGGADAFNIDKIVGCGVWPVTVATTLLKPGGYNRFVQLAEILDGGAYKEWNGIDVEALDQLAKDALVDKHHVQHIKELPSRKNDVKVPLINCYNAPCQDTCPIHQNITKYVMQVAEGDMSGALKTILERNALPHITGTICAHPCQIACTRNFYEEPINIRATKLTATKSAFEEVLPQISATGKCDKKVAVVGGGPAGIAAAYYLAREGADVTIFEREDKLGGTVANVIPGFRIPAQDIQNDVAIIKQLGVNIKTNCNIDDISSLNKDYDSVVLALGASKPGQLRIEGKEPVGAIEFLHKFNDTDGNVELGENVVVIGGGNTAMDVARAAKRNKGVKNVRLVYRRTKRFMPADAEELDLAIADGVEFLNLYSPVSHSNGVLKCSKMYLSDQRDSSGRRKVEATDEVAEIDADVVIAAVGEKVNTEFYQNNGLDVDEWGRVVVDKTSNMSSRKNVYVVGDGLGGPATVVRAMADSIKVAENIVGHALTPQNQPNSTKEECYNKKGMLVHSENASNEEQRCLNCNTVCENCVDVCPNRANVSVAVDGFSQNQVIHVDYMCNECGNCNSFCPYSSAPYLAKFTLFASVEDMHDSKNDGFVVIDADKRKYMVRFEGQEYESEAGKNDAKITPLVKIVDSVVDNYAWMLEMK